ncbi:MAG: beta-lactamase family protein, partial [Caulobacterales bacterium]|nr:beta-lactamase family protein [Caulobacterales bacterium]
WRPHLGCAQLPPGSPAERAGDLPRLTAEPPAPAQGDWPADEGGDPRLAPVAGAAFDAASYGEGTRTTALIVMQGGRVLAERYAEGFDAGASQRTWSVAKSISATIIGAAVEQGLLDVAAPAAIPEWSAPGDPRAAITLEHLLHMSSGLDSGERGSRTDRVYFGGGLVAQNAATTSLEAAPGTRWKYANNDTLLAVRALRAALADEEAYHRFPFEAVLWPLGMRDTYLETDWGGEFILSSQVWTTARDLARLALLYLNDGVWEDRRILPEGWASYVSAPSPDQPDSGAFGYGAQFWLLRGVEGLPDDSFAALGHRGQHVVIIPSADVAIVRRGFDESGGTPFDIAAFAADVLAALATASEEG